MCNIEFPHFGASYPDAHCINGYLWDMDSYEDGYYTIGGDDPCPFCNTEEWLKTVLDNEEFASREEALEWVEKMREKWGAEHRGSSEIPKDLEEASSKFATHTAPNGVSVEFLEEKLSFQEGAKWQREQDRLEIANIKAKLWQDGFDDCKEQMLKEAIRYVVQDDLDSHGASYNIPFIRIGIAALKPKGIGVGDKVRIIIVKE